METQPASSQVWFVAQTRSRCEKKLKAFCEREGIAATLPTYKSLRSYRGGKVAVFEKPLFPGYVFIRATPSESRKIYKSNHVAKVLDVFDQALFDFQLSQILVALSSSEEVFLVPSIIEGTRVRIKKGPLRGVEGLVEQRQGFVQVILRLDFIAQAAAVRVRVSDLESI